MSNSELKQNSTAYSLATIITSPNGDLTAEIIISTNEKGLLAEVARHKILWSEYFSLLEEEMVELDPHHAPLGEQFSPQELAAMWFAAVKEVRDKIAESLDLWLQTSVVSVAQLPGQPRPIESDLAILSNMFKSDSLDN